MYLWMGVIARNQRVHPMRNLTLLLVVFAFCFGVVTGQNLGINTRKGKVAKKTVEWTYLIKDGRNANELKFPISHYEYGQNGDLIRESYYGAGGVEERWIYHRSDETVLATLKYLNSEGNELKGDIKFTSNSNRSDESGLCHSYIVRSETTPHTTEKRIYETCDDGSKRAETVIEHDSRGKVIREFRSDALERSWESLFIVNESGDTTNFRFLVNDKIKPKYSQNVDYVELKKDEFGNLTGYTATLTDSNSQGRVVHQWRSIITLTYR